MTKLIVTIDDAGISTGVNAAAVQCIEAGSVDRISILPSGSAFDGALRIPGIREIQLSAHLNCIEPPFLTDGVFPSGFPNWVLYSKKHAETAKREWRAQIERLLNENLEVTGLDSHRHIHHLPGLKDAILELADEYNIGYVRTAVLPDRFTGFSGFILDSYGRKFEKSAAESGIETPDSMLGFSKSGNVSREYLLKYESAVRSMDTAELVMHPSETPEWSGGQPGELELLCSEWFTEWREKMAE